MNLPFSFRLTHEELCGWSRRVGISLDSGLDLVRVLKKEGERRSSSRYAAALCWSNVAESVVQGESLHEALEMEKDQLNELFISMVKVGEDSGHLSETLLDLADYYERMVELKRKFLQSLMLPIFELCTALFVVGLVILILGFLPAGIDILGLGMVGVSGLIKYLVFLALVFGSGFTLFLLMRNNVIHLKFAHYILHYVPKIGPLFRTLSLTRLTWALHLTLRTGMDIREALRLSFAAAAFGPISDKLPLVLEEIDSGGSLYDGFLRCNFFDEMMILHLHTGEESGNTPEIMERLSRDYFEQAQLRMKTLSVFGFFLAFFFVAGVIIFFIFRIFMSYVGMINEAGGF